MYQSINVYQFHDAFVVMDRKENFTYDGLTALYNYLEEMEESTGQDIELDVIALCCEFSQDSYSDIISNYGINIIEDNGPIEWDEVKEQVIEYLEENTCVVYSDDDTVLYQVF